MKTNLILLYLMLSIAFIFGAVNTASLSKSHAHSKKDGQVIRPNSNDLRNLVKPLIKQPYKPFEVDSIQKKRQMDNLEMTKAEIIGKHSTREGLIEKPTMYDTVITPHSTSISHANDHIIRSMQVNKKVAGKFQQGQTETAKLANGQIAIPIQMRSKNIFNDPTLSNYETPIFISKKPEKEKVEKKSLPKIPMLNPDLSLTNIADTRIVANAIMKAGSKSQKFEAIKAAKKNLKQDAKAISREVEQEVNNLADAKETAEKLNKLIKKYNLSLKKNQLSQIALVDRIEVKKELKEKLFRELQGFIVNEKKYKSLKNVEYDDIEKIVKKIKKKLE